MNYDFVWITTGKGVVTKKIVKRWWLIIKKPRFRHSWIVLN